VSSQQSVINFAEMDLVPASGQAMGLTKNQKPKTKNQKPKTES
jgi:hypothetical protein